MPIQRQAHPVFWILPIVALAAITALVLLSSSAPVRVVDATPAEGNDDVAITAPIGLVFSREMDRASVEAHFRLEPEVAGRMVGSGKELAFWPRGGLAPGTTYRVMLDEGALSQQGRPLKQGRTWQFRTRQPHLLFLGRAAADADPRQLFLASLDGTLPRPLTEHPLGVWDYAVHPLGETIAYSVLREDGGSDLWRMDRDGTDQRLLLGCPEAACLNPAWSPDGEHLAYEQRGIWGGAPNLDPRAGRIWLFDVARGKERPLFDYDVPLHSPVWGPDGQRLAYASPVLPGIEVYDLGTEELGQFGNEWGSAPVWSPDGQQLVVPNLMLAEETLRVRLIRVDVQGGQMVDISGADELVKDTAPAWSPVGGWIAFGRQFLDEERWTPGRQLWLTRPDASEAYPLLSEPMSDLFGFAWRPDAAALAYLRTDLSEGPQPVPDVSVWILDLAQRKPRLVAEGVLPKWLP
jgi:Tol biopolymer transport system component